MGFQQKWCTYLVIKTYLPTRKKKSMVTKVQFWFSLSVLYLHHKSLTNTLKHSPNHTKLLL